MRRFLLLSGWRRALADDNQASEMDCAVPPGWDDVRAPAAPVQPRVDPCLRALAWALYGVAMVVGVVGALSSCWSR
jgi:hypothetical protein